MTTTVKYLSLSQTALVIGLVICVVINPHFLFRANQGGVSNYGVYANTIVPFSLAFVGSAACYYLAGKQLQRLSGAARSLGNRLIWVAGLEMLALLTTYPYKHSVLLDNLHTAVAIVLFIAELTTVIWLLGKLRTPALTIIAATFLLGFVLSLLTYLGYLHVLFVAEVVTALAFGAFAGAAALKLGTLPKRHVQ